jgi:hypothetical protein
VDGRDRQRDEPLLISACLRRVSARPIRRSHHPRRSKAFPSLVGLGLSTVPALVVHCQESSRPRGPRVRPVSQSTGVSASTPYTGGRGASFRRWDVQAFTTRGDARRAASEAAELCAGGMCIRTPERFFRNSGSSLSLPERQRRHGYKASLPYDRCGLKTSNVEFVWRAIAI